MIEHKEWIFDVDWQLVGAIVVVWICCGIMLVISRIKPKAVRLKSRYFDKN